MVFANLPFALVGGILAMVLLKINLSVSAAIGFIALFGTAVGNGVVLVTFFNQLRQEGLSTAEAVRKGCELRFRPLLMTALAMLLGLVPMLFATGSGSEIQRPLAAVGAGRPGLLHVPDPRRPAGDLPSLSSRGANGRKPMPEQPNTERSCEMKLITAYIQPFMSEKVTDALRTSGVHGVTILPCQGFGRMADDKKSPHYLEEDAVFGFAPKTKIEIVCLDDAVPDIVATIRQHAHTGRHGDGKIFVSDIDDALDIRTGARGEGAL